MNFWIISLMVVTILVLLATIVSIDNEKKDLEIKLIEIEKKNTQIKKNLNELNTKLLDLENKNIKNKETIEKLNSSIKNKNSEIVDLKKELDKKEELLLKAETDLIEKEILIEDVKKEAILLDEKISSSINWFNENSKLPGIYKADRFKSIVQKKCLNGKKLNLGCISFAMENELGITYKSDLQDKLFSIEEIIERKGGDCEDFSLFFASTLNSLKGNGYELVAWENGEGKFEIFEDDNRLWYYEFANERKIGNLDSLNVYPVCYYFESTPNLLLGHCVVLFSDIEINEDKDILENDFSNNVLIEPQDGKYVGAIGKEFSMCKNDCDLLYSVRFIISKNDLFHYDLEWDYYKKYQEKINDLLSEWPEVPS